MRKKMVIIGAGSASFTQGLVMDLIRYPGKHKWQLALVDIEPGILDSVTKLCRKIIRGQNADLELTSSTDRRDVLPGADYIVATIGVGGRRAWEQDVFIPRKYGIYQPVGDTSMPGGISRAMRMIPALIDITKDIMELCPNARFFNYSNPMSCNCRAIRKALDFPVVGLCHGVRHSEEYVAAFAGLDKERFTAYSAGINHLTFMYDFRYDGEDVKPLIMKKLEEYEKQVTDYSTVGELFAEMKYENRLLAEPFAWSFFKDFGAYPAPGDRHITEFFTERFPGGKYYGKVLGVDAHSFEETIERGDAAYDEIGKLAHSPEPLPEDYFRHYSGEHEQLMSIINSMEGDMRQTFSVNLPNNGAVPNLPKDAVLEMPGVATAMGLCPIQLPNFPDELAAIVSKNLAIIEMTVDAALKGSTKLFAEAILMGGYITDSEAVNKMVCELVKAQQQYLPQFN